MEGLVYALGVLVQFLAEQEEALHVQAELRAPVFELVTQERLLGERTRAPALAV